MSEQAKPKDVTQLANEIRMAIEIYFLKEKVKKLEKENDSLKDAIIKHFTKLKP